MPFSILSDAPATRDLLSFDRYVTPLLSVLTNEALVTPLTIGVFGTWGSGKSTLLGLLEEALKPDKRFVCIKFNPWVHRKEPNLLVPLLHALREALEGTFRESAAKIMEVLIRLGADLVLEHFTAGVVSLERLEKYEKAYLERRVMAESQLRNLRNSLEQEARKLAKSGARLVFFIDDLDRCDPAEIVDLLEAVKLFLDIENVVHVLAMDKEVVDRGIQVKYGKFEFAKEREPVIGAEYLEKMIQVPVHLFPLHPTQVKGYIGALFQSDEVEKQIDLLAGGVSPNPRKIKRLLNAISFSNNILDSDPKRYQDMDRSLTVALGIIRVEEPGLYTAAARMPRILIALEEAYANKRNVKDVTVFGDFGSKAEAARQICEQYFRPAGQLAGIFTSVKFAAAEKRLGEYISVMGGF